MANAAAVRFFLVLLALAVLLVAAVASPFGAGLLLAAVLAAALLPLCDWLTRRLRGRSGLAAGLTVLVTFLAIVLPIVLLTGLLVREILSFSQQVAEVLQHEGVPGLVARLPGPLRRLAGQATERAPELIEELQSELGRAVEVTATLARALLVATTAGILQAIALLIALFLFLTEGRRLLAWVARISPLGPERTKALFRELRQVSVSVVGTTLIVAAVQATLALAAFLVAGAPQPILLAFATFFLAFIPALGGSVAVVTVGLVMLATGSVIAGIGLVAYAVLVVGTSDNVLKPLLIKGRSLSGGVMFFALLGGVTVFGLIGLVIGPLAVAFLLALTRLYEEEGGVAWLDAGLTASTPRPPPLPKPPAIAPPPPPPGPPAPH